jgi:hypothetical protein
MKVTFDIECTPEEARAFLGLPDVAPLQEKVMAELEKQMLENIKAMDPETAMKTWMPAAIQNWGEMQKILWGQYGAASTSPAAKTSKTGR